MRIVSGAYKGRKINPPNGLPVRPTTDFAKEGLFNILNNLIDFEATTVADLFAGTGNMAFEFYSRGCPVVTAVDIEQRCTGFIRQTAERLGMNGLGTVRSNVLVFLKHPHRSYNLVFADPPYEMEGIDRLPDEVLGSALLAEDGMFILEHSEKYDFRQHTYFLQVRKYGKVNFTFFGKEKPKGD